MRDTLISCSSMSNSFCPLHLVVLCLTSLHRSLTPYCAMCQQSPPKTLSGTFSPTFKETQVQFWDTILVSQTCSQGPSPEAMLFRLTRFVFSVWSHVNMPVGGGGTSTNTTTYNILPVPALAPSIPFLLLTVVIPQVCLYLHEKVGPCNQQVSPTLVVDTLVVSCQEYHTSGNGVCYIIYT